MYCSQFWKLTVPNQSVSVWGWPIFRFIEITFPWHPDIRGETAFQDFFHKDATTVHGKPTPMTSPRPCHFRPACWLQHKHFEGTLAQATSFLSWIKVFSRAQSSRSRLRGAHGFTPSLPRRLFHCWSDDVCIFLWRLMFFLILYFLAYLFRFGGDGAVWSELHFWLCARWGHHRLWHSDEAVPCCCCLFGLFFLCCGFEANGSSKQHILIWKRNRILSLHYST